MADWSKFNNDNDKDRDLCGEKVVSVEIQAGVTSIGNNAFYKCCNLESITLPSSVTSLGDSAFYECSSLKGITLPPSVISIGSNAFAYSSLTGIGIPSSVASIGGSAFRGCSSLARVIVQGTTPPVLDGGGIDMFTLCQFVTDHAQGIKVPLGTEAAYKAAWSEWSEYIDSASAGNGIDWTLDADGKLTIRSDTGMEEWRTVGKEKNGKNLVSVEILAGVTDIGDGAFQYCSKLTSITLPSSVTGML